MMEEAFLLAKEVGDYPNLMRAYNNIAGSRTALNGPASIVETLHEGLDLALRSGTISSAGWIAGSLGDTLLLLGRLEEAEEHQRRAIELARRMGDAPLLGMRLISLAGVVALRGRIDEAIGYRDEAAPIMAANPERQSDLFLPWFDAFAAMARGDADAAADLFSHAADLLLSFNPDVAPEAFPDCVRALLAVGRREDAERYRLDPASEFIQTRAHGATIEGLLERDPRRSVELLASAVAGLEALELRPQAARAMVDLARARRRTGEEPRELLRRAREILLECDAKLFLSEVDEVLAEVP
jgi:tetratricopeptide (TPR) repeat protein